MKRTTALASRLAPLCLALGLLGAACGGKNTIILDSEPAFAGAGSVAEAGGPPGGANSGAGAGGATQSTAGTASTAAGTTSAGGDAGATQAAGGDAGAAQAGSGGTATVCVNDSDCASSAPCVVAFCTAGACQSSNRVRGTESSRDVPADCHAQQCDGQGNLERVSDFGNVLASTELCVVATCDDQGNPSSEPSVAGVACTSAQGGSVCDGAGQCVECLTNADCHAGACVQHRCASSTCADGQQDGTETDVDCGGMCPVCADKQACQIDQDCASDDCDALELVCLPASCIDQKQDGTETDVDCGGPDCAGCYPFLKCQVNADCATQQCDPVKQQCTGNPCADHRQDGTESDIDCGGEDLACNGCKTGKKCATNFDCLPGLQCDGQVSPHVCQQL